LTENRFTEKQLVDRLIALSSFKKIPRQELSWLVKHGRYEVREAGTLIDTKGMLIEDLYIILSGKLAVRIDRGTGPKLVAQREAGTVSGLLPYSRLVKVPGDIYHEVKTEFILVNVKYFPEMINQCPVFTAHTVHTLIDRVREFNTSDLQDEKMISLGKLAAGLAHELNNPASAAVREAKQLVTALNNLDKAWRALSIAGLSEDQLKKIEEIRTTCIAKPGSHKMSPIQIADRQEDINDWLLGHNLDADMTAELSDTAVTIEILNTLAALVSGETLNLVINWMVASCSPYTLATEMEQAATQIYKLVNTVKKFTYMDNLTQKELIDLEPGIRDTAGVLASRVKAKDASIAFDIAKNLPPVCANGSELNQVWLSLIDNALDAIPQSGNIHIKAVPETKHVVIKIIDNGPGIAPEIMPRIFDPFFTTKAPGKGTGLGLDTARRLLQRCQGDISVESVPGRTEFRVILLTEISSPA